MKTPIIAFAAFAASVLLEAAPPENSQKPEGVLASRFIEFAGYTTAINGQVFALYDGETKESSPWIKIGRTWHGYTLMSFDLKAEKLRVKTANANLYLELRGAKVAQAISLPALVSGTYALVDGTLFYSTEAQLKLDSGMLISSPTGVMVSDPEQKTVAGDLTIQTEKGTMQVTDAVIDVAKKKVTAKTMTMQVKSEAKNESLTKR